jgi:hypothetical protein
MKWRIIVGRVLIESTRKPATLRGMPCRPLSLSGVMVSRSCGHHISFDERGSRTIPPATGGGTPDNRKGRFRLRRAPPLPLKKKEVFLPVIRGLAGSDTIGLRCVFIVRAGRVVRYTADGYE